MNGIDKCMRKNEEIKEKTENKRRKTIREEKGCYLSFKDYWKPLMVSGSGDLVTVR